MGRNGRQCWPHQISGTNELRPGVGGASGLITGAALVDARSRSTEAAAIGTGCGLGERAAESGAGADWRDRGTVQVAEGNCGRTESAMVFRGRRRNRHYD